ncbi:MAG TPA: hypothetical protein VHC86_16575 [Opitutaceae bacterium]|nr:hypothetical protein [Opitutaceae bacterium]
MKLAPVLPLLVLLSAAQAAPAVQAGPAVLSRDAQGVTVNAELIRQYAELCQRYPAFGDKAGDGVVVLDVDRFRLDKKHYVDYLSMAQLEKIASVTKN